MGLADDARAQVEANRRRAEETRDRAQAAKPDWGPELIGALRAAAVPPVTFHSDYTTSSPVATGWVLVQAEWMPGDLSAGGWEYQKFGLTEDGRWFRNVSYWPTNSEAVAVSPSMEMTRAFVHDDRDVAVAALTSLMEGSATRLPVGLEFKKIERLFGR